MSLRDKLAPRQLAPQTQIYMNSAKRRLGQTQTPAHQSTIAACAPNVKNLSALPSLRGNITL